MFVFIGQCWSICEGRGFDPRREQVLTFSNRYFLNKHWILALAKIYYILPFRENISWMPQNRKFKQFLLHIAF